MIVIIITSSSLIGFALPIQLLVTYNYLYALEGKNVRWIGRVNYYKFIYYEKNL